ncbi:glycosyltransferase family 57 protein [Serpula lacrymans var. lacrymans S7.3]|uniref:Alpha-1,3-glucosyltransferase n=2 Tax=Serpula lacrymans var. lacrymans TaxID=341189 RepID=F8Q0Q6_SERL3|nr:glycosyltransferase family 57 protein [Serpula lacrymans var. lacrymans S7.9]EGN97885.1 glycosyltransferase family 57 protein [Serpula lacrymans var. lacrymans S7.3]EGO23465.1 glycosyltransferase family 57 protein [Serpula lacrymans var. lacrymans S7.9]
MDEVSAFVPPEGAPKRQLRDRTTSFNSLPYIKPAKLRVGIDTTKPVLRNRASASSMKSAGSPTERSEIISPIPRRHLLQTSESQHWLHPPATPPFAVSREPSPVSATSTVASFRRRKASTQHMNFSALMEQERMRSFPSYQTIKPNDHEEEPGAGRRWVRWMHKNGLKQWIVPSAVGAAMYWKWCIGLGGYSGYATPPIYGDYEAQRHWMEITIHLPFHQWYTYDLQYWGLDYPPLTAYVSWLCGKIGTMFNPQWFALDQSRGIETPDSKVFMRATVLALDTVVYVPAIYLFIWAWQGTRSSRTQHLALLTLLFQPALHLVDFGHFQYNSVMLGLTLFAMNMFASGQDLLGAFFFVLSLGFKQMALYYAPAIGSYLLGKCIYLGPVHGLRLFTRLAAVTVVTFLVLFLPFLPPFSSFTTILDPITRIFPFNRGLFEDKVANFWCATNVAFKWKHWLASNVLVKISSALTFIGFLPSVIGLIQGSIKTRVWSSSQESTQAAQIESSANTPTLPLLPYALLTSSLSFFLFSFQVHEKTILLPLMPMTLLLSGSSPDSAAFSWGALMNNVAVFSMWPLLKRDGLGIQYIATLVVWNRLIGYNPLRLRKKSFVDLLSTAVYGACVFLHLLEFVFTPPARYPDLFPVLNVLVSTPVFVLIWLWSIKRGVEVGWALEGLPGSRNMKTSASQDRFGVESTAQRAAAANGESMRRDMGVRAMSLGYGESRRRLPFRAQSVEVEENS